MPFDFRRFGSLNIAFLGHRFANDDKLKHCVLQEHRPFSKSFLRPAGGKCVLIMKETQWKNHFNFV
jgi:hypothetical protein